MTHDEMIAVIAAHRDGKRIQFSRHESRNHASRPWADTDCPGFSFELYDYRVKPEPKRRPWKHNEVPLPLVIRRHDSKAAKVATEIDDSGVWFMAGRTADYVTFAVLKTDFVHSTDGGKTWKPCVVEEAE